MSGNNNKNNISHSKYFMLFVSSPSLTMFVSVNAYSVCSQVCYVYEILEWLERTCYVKMYTG